ncbi:M28 family peptidase [Okeania sp.]|uniref:M28 family peptidase n=1 Tax=Okeania sp. TaxID=3100323 RepID=UPI002B4B155A|nr:M28 family peptidase [Okeania sp.]MEB3341533.1 M28 family peptidase [Okeania sp.]
MLKMPGESYRGVLPPLTEAEIYLKYLLEYNLHKLAVEIGERNYSNYSQLRNAANFIASEFSKYNYQVRRQTYQVDNQTFENLEVEIKGSYQPEQIVVVGSHYDSVFNCPGANDNGTGTVAVLELARKFSEKKTSRTLRFVEFANEEPPFFRTLNMGSFVYAKNCRQNQENIFAMFSLETIGYYSDNLGSQKFPPGLDNFYPSTGNYITFVSNMANRKLVCDAISSFRRHTKFPSEGAALPALFSGVDLSDHWAFWQQNYPALMVTDTAFLRYPYYHQPEDTIDKIDFDRFTRVVVGLERVIADFVGVIS